MKEAIKKAIEGGYTTWAGANPEDYVPSQVLLDPLFWQALDRAMKWSEVGFHEGNGQYAHNNVWEIIWRRFIDHLIAGKDIDSFFKDLIK